MQPGVDAVGVEEMAAPGEPAQLLAGLHLPEAHRAVHRRGLRVSHCDHGGVGDAAGLMVLRARTAAAGVGDGEVEEEGEDAHRHGEPREQQPRARAVPGAVGDREHP